MVVVRSLESRLASVSHQPKHHGLEAVSAGALLVTLGLAGACAPVGEIQGPTRSAATTEGLAPSASKFGGEIPGEKGSAPRQSPSHVMVGIPAGTFLMGSTEQDEEQPVHEEHVAAFEMDLTEVTVAQYRACVEAAQCAEPVTGDGCNWDEPGRDDHPINCASWDEARVYCEDFAGKRLPTEREWEYAARGNDGRPYPWGADAPSGQLCWRRSDPRSGTCGVGTHPEGASPFGLLDMAGNVSEWTSTFYCRSYAPHAECTTVPVHRGGCWLDGDYARYVRAAQRDATIATATSALIGFRCARSLP